MCLYFYVSDVRNKYFVVVLKLKRSFGKVFVGFRALEEGLFTFMEFFRVLGSVVS